MEIIDDYKSYKNKDDISNEKYMTKRNLVKFLYLKKFGKKYGDRLHYLFGIMDDVDSYQALMDKYGKKNLIKALNENTDDVSKIADILYNGKYEEKEKDDSFFIKSIEKIINLHKSTGILLNDKLKINLDNFIRDKFEKDMIDILTEQKIKKKNLKEICDIYENEIISEYIKDQNLKNKTILYNGERFNNKGYSRLQDHVTDYTEDDFKNILNKYFNNELIDDNEKTILIGLLVKGTDLLGEYGYDNLIKNQEYIKKEIEIGIFYDVVLKDINIDPDKRKMMTELSGEWDSNDFDEYNNLKLLFDRTISNESKKEIEDILSMNLDQIIKNKEEVKDRLNDLYFNYEIENRENIINQIYDPVKQDIVIIDDRNMLDKGLILHFFDVNKNVYSFDKYIDDLEKKMNVKYTDLEKKQLYQQYQIKNNHFIINNNFQMEAIGKVSTFEDNYVTNTSNQLSSMIVTPNDLIDGKGIRGNLALGFSKKTLDPELIATISNENIYSNKGINYVESLNDFSKFSSSYNELITNKKNRQNTEIVLFRNSFESTLKPSYVMYIAYEDLKSKLEQDNIANVRKQMKEAGLNCSLVIIDNNTILKKDMINQTPNVEISDNIMHR